MESPPVRLRKASVSTTPFGLLRFFVDATRYFRVSYTYIDVASGFVTNNRLPI